jgi:hypothetical protein
MVVGSRWADPESTWQPIRLQPEGASLQARAAAEKRATERMDSKRETNILNVKYRTSVVTNDSEGAANTLGKQRGFGGGDNLIRPHLPGLWRIRGCVWAVINTGAAGSLTYFWLVPRGAAASSTPRGWWSRTTLSTPRHGSGKAGGAGSGGRAPSTPWAISVRDQARKRARSGAMRTVVLGDSARARALSVRGTRLRGSPGSRGAIAPGRGVSRRRL